MLRRYALPAAGLLLIFSIMTGGCQKASENSTASSVSEEFSNGPVESIENISDYVKDFEYKDIKAKSENDAWKELLKRAEITGYPEGELNRTEYIVYENYENLAVHYNTDMDTMLKEEMNMTPEEMVKEIKREAKVYTNTVLISRYILEKENYVTLENLGKVDPYYLSDESTEKTEFTRNAYNISSEDALSLAELWLNENIIQK